MQPSTLCNKSEITPSSVKNYEEAPKSFLRGCRAKMPPSKGEEAPKSFLRGCRSGIPPSKGEETPKSFLRGCRVYFYFFYLRHTSLA